MTRKIYNFIINFVHIFDSSFRDYYNTSQVMRVKRFTPIHKICAYLQTKLK